MYKLYIFFPDDYPPLLQNENGDFIYMMRDYTFEDKTKRQVKYIIGSTQFVDAEFRSATPETAEYFPDPNWDVYPSDNYPMNLIGDKPVTHAYTDYNFDDNQYLYYSPPPLDHILVGYSRLLRAHILSTLNIPTPKIQVEDQLLQIAGEYKQYETEKKKIQADIKKIQADIKKLETPIKYQQRADKRAGITDSPELQNLMSQLDQLNTQLNQINTQLNQLNERAIPLINVKQSLERDLKQLKKPISKKPKLKKR